jgi:hypothetical protein
MFKKKDKDVTLKIGLHPIETPELPSKGSGSSSFMKWTLISVAIVVGAIVISGIVMKSGNKQAPALTPVPPVVAIQKPTNTKPEPVSNPVTTPIPITGVGVSTPVSGVIDPSTPPADGTAKPALTYVDYKNGLLGVQVGYPSKWYYTERTNESLGVLNPAIAGGKFNINETVTADVVQIADFYPSDKSNTRVTVTLVPETKMADKQNGVLKSTITDGSNLLVAEAATSVDVNGVAVESINYVLEDKLKLKHNTTQMVFPFGKSFVVFTGFAEESGIIADKVLVMTEMIKSFKIS